MDNILKRLENEGLAINLQKCEFAKNIIEWLGFTITPSGITPLVTKTEAITKLKKNPESKNNKLDWREEHSSAFNNIKSKIHQIIENKHFDTTKQTRVKCNDSAKGLGLILNKNITKNGIQLSSQVDFKKKNMNPDTVQTN